MSSIIPQKQCTKCKQLHPPTAEYFTKDKHKPDGLCSWCKTCRRENKIECRVEVETRTRKLLLDNPNYSIEYHRNNNGLKQCSRCEAWLLATDENFYLHFQKPDGLRPECKQCTKKYRVEFNQNNVEYVRQRGRKYYQLSLVRNYKGVRSKQKQQRQNARQRGTAKLYFRQYYHEKKSIEPHKYQARSAVSVAVASGKMSTINMQICELCGKQAQHYHHWSYLPEYWLDVIPLCAVCHRKVHAS